MTEPSPSVVHLGPADSAAVRSTFRAPSAPRHHVWRERLISLLNDLAEYPVTVITAPAGAGKSVLAAEWSRQVGHPCAWVTLDEADREPGQLWHSLASALDVVRRGTGIQTETQRLAAGNGSGRTTLVIDGLDRIDDDEQACAALESFVAQRPAPVHLLLLSRHRPPLPVDRLRAAGELADIDFGALRFSDSEAADLLTALCPDISAADRAAGVRRADGWAAALQLTALWLRSHRHPPAKASVPATAGPHRLVDEYLWEEVLGSERPELVTLLLSAAVVGRLDSGLAEALTQSTDAGDLLGTAEARGLFLVGLDDGGWFELHSLVRDVLMDRFQRRWPEALREQHGRAAGWYERSGDELTALDHWLRAERPEEALRVLADLALSLLDSGRWATVAHGVDQLPPEIATADRESAIRYAWCQLMVDRGSFAEALTLARWACADADPAVRARLDVLSAAAASLTGDWARSGALARTALSVLPDHGWTEPVGRFGWRLVTHALAFAERWDDAAPTLVEARAASSHDLDGRRTFEGTRAVGLALAGHPLDAQRVAAGARQLTHPGPLAMPSAELVQLRMSTGELDAAQKSFEEAEALCARLSRLGAEGEVDVVDSGPPSSMRSSLARVAVDLSLATDHAEDAARWSRRVVDPFWSPMCEAKIYLAVGRPEDATEAIARAVCRSSRQGVLRDLVRARAVLDQDRHAAATAVRHAMETANRKGMLQSFASEGAALLEYIELAAWCVSDAWMGRLRHALLPTWAGRDVKGPIDALTDREREVLRLLPSRLTLREIASELYVSQNTLKFHLRAIYRKLDVASRAEAVDSARDLRLLPRG